MTLPADPFNRTRLPGAVPVETRPAPRARAGATCRQTLRQSVRKPAGNHQTRNAFGQLLVDPGTLDLSGRVEALRRLVGRLQADTERESQWIAGAFQAWLRDGGDLADHLGLKPLRGSHGTPQALMRQATTDRALMRLAVVAGSVRRASQILRGLVECPPACVELVAELRELEAPASEAAITRARGRAARHTR